MKKGFTLMEILAVLLVIAVIASFAVPVISSVRAEIRYQRAKSAALKMAEAMRTFYRDTKGWTITENSSIDGNGTQSVGSCEENPAVTGIPGRWASSEVQDVDIRNLFACGYLSSKDFVGLPYNFKACNPSSSACGLGPAGFLLVTGQDGAGKYMDQRFSVQLNMRICELDNVNQCVED